MEVGGIYSELVGIIYGRVPKRYITWSASDLNIMDYVCFAQFHILINVILQAIKTCVCQTFEEVKFARLLVSMKEVADST